jgi:hypothetical protein
MRLVDPNSDSFPRKFRYCPQLHAGQFRDIVITEIRRPEPEAVLRLKAKEEFVLDEKEYRRLFLNDRGPLYDHKKFEDLGPVSDAKKQAKAEKPAK